MRSVLAFLFLAGLAGSISASSPAATPSGALTDDPSATERAADGSALELSGATLRFATADTAASLLAAKDAFVRRQSPFDRQLRLGSLEPVAIDDYLAFVSEQALDWEPAERAAVAEAVRTIAQGIEEQGLALPLPAHIDLLKTTGREELDACGYTREAFIVLSARCLDGPPQAAPPLSELLAHELVHVLTRHDPELRDALYATIGFEPLGTPFVDPADVDALRLTNPDAPIVEHVITLELDGEAVRLVPALYSPGPYDGGPFGTFFDPRLLRIDDDGSAERTPGGALHLYAYDELPAFFERVGANTDYIIHPEEIVADNVALLVLGRGGQVRSPHILAAIAELLGVTPSPS